jgi:hypothetical protein
MSNESTSGEATNRRQAFEPRVVWLGFQTLLLGMLAGFIIIPASGLFISNYGSDKLPLTYLVIAVTGLLGTRSLSRALQRHSIARVAIPILLSYVVITLGAWIELETLGNAWVAGPLLVLFPHSFQIGFVLIGGQAGAMFNVRELKTAFPRIVSGFPAGFIVAGLVAAVSISRIGGAYRLLTFSAAASMALLLLMHHTTKRFVPTSRSVPSSTVSRAVDAARPKVQSVSTLMRQPFVLALFAYQMLSQIGTQLVDFLLYDRAAQRFRSSDSLSTFVSNFTWLLNALELLFLLLIAGYLLRRFGVRLGLSLNGVSVLLAVVAVLVIGNVTGAKSLSTLVLIGAARIIDIGLSNAATRSSLNTVFQALPINERMASQAIIEGTGPPVAIGLAGLLILLLQGVLHLSFLSMVLFTVAVCAVWVVVGIVVFRHYRHALRHGLAQRTLPVDQESDSHATAMTEGNKRTYQSNHSSGVHLESAAAPVIRALRKHVVLHPDTAVNDLILHVSHDQREVGLAACRLLAVATEPQNVQLAAIRDQLLREDAAHALRILTAVKQIDHTLAMQSSRDNVAQQESVTRQESVAQRDSVTRQESVAQRHSAAWRQKDLVLAVLRRSLLDELNLLGERALAALALTNDRTIVANVARQLRRIDERSRALAIETLDVHVPASQIRFALPLVSLSRPVNERVSLLRSALGNEGEQIEGAVGERSLDAALASISIDEGNLWRRPWLRECTDAIRNNVGTAMN